MEYPTRFETRNGPHQHSALHDPVFFSKPRENKIALLKDFQTTVENMRCSRSTCKAGDPAAGFFRSLTRVRSSGGATAVVILTLAPNKKRRHCVMETPQNAKHTASSFQPPSFRPSSLWLCHGSQLCTSPVSAGVLTCSWSGFLCDKDSSAERRDRCVIGGVRATYSYSYLL